MSNYEVGRGRPPISTRFEKGKSGNPSGRPKKMPTFRTELLAELGELMPAGGGDRVSKQRAVIRKLIDAALGGNLRATGALFSILARLPEDQDADSEEPSDRDLEIIKDLAEREEAASSDGNTGEDQPA